MIDAIFIQSFNKEILDFKLQNLINRIYSNLNNPKIRIKYANMFPTDLSDIKFDSTQGADTILTATAKFRFDFFNIERL